MCKNLGDPKNPSMYEHFTEMNLKNGSVIFITLGLPWLTFKLVIAEKKNYQFRNNLSNTLSDVLWSLLKDT